MVLSAGAVVGGYRIERVLGSGGMGTVYLAANPVLPRHDALKVLSAELSRDPAFRSRFIREADLAATLDHPNIVAVYNRGETDDGHLWIAMQYVAGTDAQAQQDAGHMPPARAVYIVGEIAKALDYAHRRNLVHRDVKPANFLLAPDDQGERVLLADFGIARALDDSAGLTATGMVVATVAYAAPETFSGEPVDGRSDIYSLGCSLYRLLTGQAPFASSGPVSAVMMAHLTQPPPRVTDVVPGLPRALDTVIAKAMAKEPAQRYQSARDFAAAAAGALHGQPGPVQPPVNHGTGHQLPGHYGGPQTRMHPWPPPVDRGTEATVPHASASGSTPWWRRRWTALLAALLLVVTVGAAGLLLHGEESAPRIYLAQSFDTVHGTVEISEEPHKVVTLGPGDADAVLSLGVQPVALRAEAKPPSWQQRMITGAPKLLTGIDPTAIAAVHPDVIIATGEIDDTTYSELTAIAPTLTRPRSHSGPGWQWQDRLSWIGRILGREDQANELLETATDAQEQLRAAHPAFQGKTLALVSVSGDGVTATLSPSDASGYLEGLGFRYTDTLQRDSGDRSNDRRIDDLAQFFTARTDAVLVLRTDKHAGSGTNGLPAPFYGRILIAVNSADIIAALGAGGPAATDYLNTALVPILAHQFH